MEQKDYFPAIPAFREPQKTLLTLDSVFNLNVLDKKDEYCFRTDARNVVYLKFQRATSGMLRKIILRYSLSQSKTISASAGSDFTLAILKTLKTINVTPPTGLLTHITEKPDAYQEGMFNAVYRLVYHHRMTFFIEAYDYAFTEFMQTQYLKKHGIERYNQLIERTKSAFLDGGV